MHASLTKCPGFFPPKAYFVSSVKLCMVIQAQQEKGHSAFIHSVAL